MANRLSVQLDGREYTIVSEESREYMLEISDIVNKKLADIKIQNNKLSTSMAALLVSLNLADELKKAEKATKDVINENEELKKRLDAAKQYIQTHGINKPAANSNSSESLPFKK